MGSDKALLSLPESDEASAINRGTTGGLTFVEHLAGLLVNVCDEVVIVARDEVHEAALSSLPFITRISSQRLNVVHDLVPNNGPLMGLYTGLSAIHSPYALVTAVDMPLVQPALLAFLLSLPRNDALIVPVVADTPQVLLALYPRSVLQQIQERVQAGRRDPRSLLEIVPVHYIDEAQLRTVDPELRSFVNVNTREEYNKLT